MANTISLSQHLLSYFLKIDERTVEEIHQAYTLKSAWGLSSYHQLVRKPGRNYFSEEKIHILAPSSIADDAEYHLKQMNYEVTPVGETYALPPYMMGFASHASYHADTLQGLGRFCFCQGNCGTYVANWLGTPEGEAVMAKDLLDEDIDLDEEDITEILQEDGEEAVDLKIYYAQIITDEWDTSRKTRFFTERALEMTRATGRLTQDQLKGKLLAYIESDPHDEEETRRENIARYKNSVSLFAGIL